jgi:hypothetical protein
MMEGLFAYKVQMARIRAGKGMACWGFGFGFSFPKIGVLVAIANGVV